MRRSKAPQTVGRYPIVKRERDAIAVYDMDAQEVVCQLHERYWALSKSKWLREHGTGHKCVYLGWPVPEGSRV